MEETFTDVDVINVGEIHYHNKICYDIERITVFLDENSITLSCKVSEYQ